MEILIVTDAYPPEIRSAAHLMQELAEALLGRNHNVTVLTGYPRYNLDEDLKSQTFNEFSDENGTKIIRVKTIPYHNVPLLVRGVGELTLPFLFLRSLRKYVKEKIDCVIVYSPPLPLGIVGSIVKRKYKARFILNLQDIFPQNGIDIGKIRNPFVIKFYEAIEKFVYKRADKITTHSAGNRDFLLERKHVPSGKVTVLSNWIDVKPFRNPKKDISPREKFSLQDKFIIIFAGVIGYYQGLDIVIKVATEVKNYEDIVFLIVGDGAEKKKIIQAAKEANLKNVVFRGFVAKEEYPALIKDSDIGLVCLNPENQTPVVPGKLLGYMAAGIPVLAFLQRQSDAHKLIKEAKCGYSTFSDDPQKAAKLVLKVYEQKDKLKQLGANGQKYVTGVFSIEKAVEKIEALFYESPVSALLST